MIDVIALLVKLLCFLKKRKNKTKKGIDGLCWSENALTSLFCCCVVGKKEIG